MSSDRVTVSVSVPCDPAAAFTIFTEETDLWWRKGPAYRMAGRNPGVLKFDAGLGGRLLETVETGGCSKEYVKGVVTAWEPPGRFAFEWRGGNFAPGEVTAVEVLFEATPTGTRVTVHHSGWSALRPDHPVRHGKPAPEFIRDLGMWWAELMRSYRERVAGRGDRLGSSI